jgi:hypothetical protein
VTPNESARDWRGVVSDFFNKTTWANSSKQPYLGGPPIRGVAGERNQELWSRNYNFPTELVWLQRKGTKLKEIRNLFSLSDKIIPNALSLYKNGREKHMGQRPVTQDGKHPTAQTEARRAPFPNGTPLKVAGPS